MQNSYALSSHGGGIYNDGSVGSAALTILNSTVSLNRAAYSGGGIHNEDGTVTIMNSTIDGNIAAYNDFPVGGGQGGGITLQVTIPIAPSAGNSSYGGEVCLRVLPGHHLTTER